MAETDNSAVFVAGYDKGRADGIAQTLAVLNMAIDYYPGMLPNSGAALLPGDTGRKIATLVENFGTRLYKEGKKDVKEWQKRKAAEQGQSQ